MTAYDEGFTAALNHEPDTANPYRGEQPETCEQDWLNGWVDGMSYSTGGGE